MFRVELCFDDRCRDVEKSEEVETADEARTLAWGYVNRGPVKVTNIETGDFEIFEPLDGYPETEDAFYDKFNKVAGTVGLDEDLASVAVQLKDIIGDIDPAKITNFVEDLVELKKVIERVMKVFQK